MVDTRYDSRRRAVGQGEFPIFPSGQTPIQHRHITMTKHLGTNSIIIHDPRYSLVTPTLIIHQTLGAENSPKSALLSYTIT